VMGAMAASPSTAVDEPTHSLGVSSQSISARAGRSPAALGLDRGAP